MIDQGEVIRLGPIQCDCVFMKRGNLGTGGSQCEDTGRMPSTSQEVPVATGSWVTVTGTKEGT